MSCNEVGRQFADPLAGEMCGVLSRPARLVLPALLLVTGCASSIPPPRTASAPQAPGLTGGPSLPMRPTPYLAPGELPAGIILVPPPPEAGSAGQARDVEGAKRAMVMRGGPRWSLAVSDAELFTPKSTAALACAAGRQIDAEVTPATFKLLSRAAIDFANSTASAKNKYKRPRPFMENGAVTCTPGAESHLRHNGFYPSGHSAIGYGWGLVLAQLAPARTTELVARGRAFGDSRRVCNVHWLSDVEEGRFAATAAFARLQAKEDFQFDLAAARQELSRELAIPPVRDCTAEAAALATE